MKDEFKNEIINGIHCSRYIASWTVSGGNFVKKAPFVKWLETLVINGRHLEKEETDYIWRFATNGKLELECQAEEFLKLGA